jgi:hypothetical protein
MEINAVTPATSGFHPSGRRRPGNQNKGAVIKTCLGPAPLSLFCSGTEFRNSLVPARNADPDLPKRQYQMTADPHAKVY